ALSAELDALRDPDGGLHALVVFPRAGAADVLDVGPELRVRQHTRLERMRIAGTDLRRAALELGVLGDDERERLPEGQRIAGVRGPRACLRREDEKPRNRCTKEHCWSHSRSRGSSWTSS